MNQALQKKRIAIVCDWLTNMGGAEKVILSLHRLFPEAPIFTTLFDKKRVQGFENAEIHASFLQKIPFAKAHHQLMLGWMPMAVESLNLNDFDIVISSSHSVAKGIITKPETVHICYCHTPMRYAWEPWELEYRLSGFPKILHSRIRKRMHEIRIWDRLSADRVDHFIANSNHVAERIRKYYRRESTVIYPPVRTDEFQIGTPKNYYLTVGRLIPYKRFDLVIEAFGNSPRPPSVPPWQGGRFAEEVGVRQLVIVGSGPEEKKLKKMAGKNIRFLGHVSDEKLKELYSGCQALIHPQIEDFGLSTVEAMASGRPVIAFAEGGALETVVEGKTGLFFHEQSSSSLIEALSRFESRSWNPHEIKAHAENFSEKEFQKNILQYIEQKIQIPSLQPRREG